MDRELLKQATHLSGSFTFGSQAQRFVHELGHAMVAWMAGGVVYSIEIHPFMVGHSRSSPIPYPGVKAWAGSVCSAGFGLLLIAILWRMRGQRASLAPIWMIGIAALLVNGTYLIVGAIARVGDAGYLVDRIGTSPAAILAAGALMLTIGVVALIATQGPLLGIGMNDSTARRAVIFGTGILPYRALVLAYGEAFNTGESVDAAGYLAVAAVLVLLVAVASRGSPPYLERLLEDHGTASLTWRQAITVLMSAAFLVTMMLVLFG